MSLISYSQNNEDIILWRAMRDLPTGFYVDVGANHPSLDSVTLLFYQRGWRGINIEPSPECFEALVMERLRDINLNVAAGDHDGSITFYDSTTRGWSTTDPEVGAYYVSQGRATTRVVELRTMDTILQQYGEREIHFLKVDVEGAEATVLHGLDLVRHRPWVIVVEVLDPMTQRLRTGEWEPYLLASGYDIVYFDGLNRFYLSHEHMDLAKTFAYPPNVLDGFRNSNEVELEQRLLQAEARLQQVEAKLKLKGRHKNQVKIPLSWKIVKQLLGGKAHRDRTRSRLRGAVRKVLGSTAELLDRFPWAKRSFQLVFAQFPALEDRLSDAFFTHRLNRINTTAVKVSGLNDDERLFPINTDQVRLPLQRGERILYIYVDHTSRCPTNTGVQRVTRNLAKGLIAQGECVRFVKWHPASQSCIFLSAEERENLAHWNGPAIAAEEHALYVPVGKAQTPVANSTGGENNWLVVPEVPYITFHPEPVTLDLVMWAKRAGLKSGFVFYDAIPLRSLEFVSVVPAHSVYMQQLLLADAVWPISNWSRNDLLVFWLENERADAHTVPTVETHMLSGESSVHTRVTEVSSGELLILSVGTIDSRKNQLMLIDAFLIWRRQNPGTSWRMVLVGNLHPSVADEVRRSTQPGSGIEYLGHVSENELDALFRSCAFTVFPSLEEGFGLPILESLWYAKPCLCANFGSMAEVADEGGCLQVNMRDTAALEDGLRRLIEEEAMRGKLAAEAVHRSMRSWDDYAAGISEHINRAGRPSEFLNVVYFWIDSTSTFPNNTGIQRVVRQLSRALLALGLRLVPVKWHPQGGSFQPASPEDLTHLARWNGPDPCAWSAWRDPQVAGAGSWFFMPELPLNLAPTEREKLIRFCHVNSLRCVGLFYDAIPWKMRRIYPPHFSEAHRSYMTQLADYDLVLPISRFSRNDLVDFLGKEMSRPQSLEAKIKAVTLAGEFAESPRARQEPAPHAGPLRVLCVGTVEPRKNHEALLHAFIIAAERIPGGLELTLVGGSHSIEPALAERVRAFIAIHSGIKWEEDADDSRLCELYLQSDFTVYPSIEEGFGLPILESLWYGRPCICADFGAMYEIGRSGGCLMVDVREPKALADSLVRIATQTELRERLAREALTLEFKSWSDYAQEVSLRMVAAAPLPAAVPVPLVPAEIIQRASAMRLKPRPKLSVCISTYNRADWLSASLRNWASMYPQPLEGVELLVCDNTSTDHTPDVVAPYLLRRDFAYHRNLQNVGMLGNLRETAHHATGEYVWILGDDDLLLPGAVERLLMALHQHPDIALIYLNYAYTREEDARKIIDFEAFFRDATPIVSPEPDCHGPIRTICARNENFFTAIYTLVFRRDHAIKAYSQDTSGRPFSSMLTCIPTTNYVLAHMMDLPGLWIGTPQIVVNLNVSWMKYAPLWILERIPEVYEAAELCGVPSEDMDRWRAHTLPGVVHYFQEIYRHDPLNNSAYFSPERLIRRFKHLPAFAKAFPVLKEAYTRAHTQGHPAAIRSPEKVFYEQTTG